MGRHLRIVLGRDARPVLPRNNAEELETIPVNIVERLSRAAGRGDVIGVAHAHTVVVLRADKLTGTDKASLHAVAASFKHSMIMSLYLENARQSNHLPCMACVLTLGCVVGSHRALSA